MAMNYVNNQGQMFDPDAEARRQADYQAEQQARAKVEAQAQAQAKAEADARDRAMVPRDLDAPATTPYEPDWRASEGPKGPEFKGNPQADAYFNPTDAETDWRYEQSKGAYLGPENKPQYDANNASPGKRARNRALLIGGGVVSAGAMANRFWDQKVAGNLDDPNFGIDDAAEMGAWGLGAGAAGYTAKKVMDAKYKGGAGQFAKNVAGNVGDRVKQGVWDPMATGIRASRNNEDYMKQKVYDDARRPTQPREVGGSNWQSGAYDDPTAKGYITDEFPQQGDTRQYDSPTVDRTSKMYGDNRVQDTRMDGMIEQGAFTNDQVTNIRSQQARIAEAKQIADTFPIGSDENLKATNRVQALNAELSEMAGNPAGTAGEKVKEEAQRSQERADTRKDYTESAQDFGDKVAGATGPTREAAGEATDAVGDQFDTTLDKINKYKEQMKGASRKVKKMLKNKIKLSEAELETMAGNDTTKKSEAPEGTSKKQGKIRKAAGAAGKGGKVAGLAELLNLGIQGTANLARSDYDLGDMGDDAVRIGKDIYGSAEDTYEEYDDPEGFRWGDAAKDAWNAIPGLAEDTARGVVNLPGNLGSGAANIYANAIEGDDTGEIEYKGDEDSWFGRFSPENYGLTDYGKADLGHLSQDELMQNQYAQYDNKRVMEDQERGMFDGRTMEEQVDYLNEGYRADEAEADQIAMQEMEMADRGITQLEGDSVYDEMPITAPGAFDAGQGEVLPIQGSMAQYGQPDMEMPITRDDAFEFNNLPGTNYEIDEAQRVEDQNERDFWEYSDNYQQELDDTDAMNMVDAESMYDIPPNEMGSGVQTAAVKPPGTDGNDAYQTPPDMDMPPAPIEMDFERSNLEGVPENEMDTRAFVGLGEQGINDFSQDASGQIVGRGPGNAIASYGDTDLGANAGLDAQIRAEQAALSQNPEYMEAQAKLLEARGSAGGDTELGVSEAIAQGNQRHPENPKMASQVTTAALLASNNTELQQRGMDQLQSSIIDAAENGDNGWFDDIFRDDPSTAAMLADPMSGHVYYNESSGTLDIIDDEQTWSLDLPISQFDPSLQAEILRLYPKSMGEAVQRQHNQG